MGGLSVVRALRERLPGVPLAYVCDNAALPYGTKADDWLVARIVAVCAAAVAASDARVLVVACNTASTLALVALRERLTIPVVGTVPAIKPAAALSESGVIGLLATSATVCRPYTDRLIADFATGHTVVRVAADTLVAEAERLLAEGTANRAVIDAALAPLWRDARLDTVVLGCTHFPLLGEYFRAPRPITWIDSGDAIARRVAQIINIGDPFPSDHVDLAWATDPGAAGLIKALSGFGFASARRLVVPGAVPSEL